MDDNEKRRDQRRAYLEAHLDSIIEERITAAVEGPLGPAALRNVVDTCRTDAILNVKYQLFSHAKPSEIRAAVQAFEALDMWMAAKGPEHTGSVKAKRVQPADMERVRKLIQEAREASW